MPESASPSADDQFVYLLHFQNYIAPGRHSARHYIGFVAGDLARRIQQHSAGGCHAARICQVAAERHNPFVVARVWRGSRADERRLKRRKEGPAFCPICSEHPVNVGGLVEVSAGDLAELLLPF